MFGFYVVNLDMLSINRPETSQMPLVGAWFCVCLVLYVINRLLSRYFAGNKHETSATSVSILNAIGTLLISLMALLGMYLFLLIMPLDFSRLLDVSNQAGILLGLLSINIGTIFLILTNWRVEKAAVHNNSGLSTRLLLLIRYQVVVLALSISMTIVILAASNI
jgi:hypothetical protein